MSDKAWSGKTGGARWMQQWLIKIFSKHPVRSLYPLMFLWIIGYIIFAPSTRKGIYCYWRDRKGLRGYPAFKNVWLSYVAFGKVILDRFAAWAGQRVTTVIENRECLDKLLSQEPGFIVLSTHIGNQELAGYNFQMPRPMYTLVYMGDTDTVNARRSATFEAMGIRVIPYCMDGTHVVAMHNALSEGNILSIHGDRMLPHVRKLQAPILGELAAFPEGPFRVAVTEQLPVLTMFMMREGDGRYRLYFKQLSDGNYIAQSRKEKEQELLSLYVAAIEEIVERYPHQWFHFYDFWKK